MPQPPKKQAASSRDLDHDGDVDLADDAANDLNRDGRLDANDRDEHDLDNDQDIDVRDRELRAEQGQGHEQEGKGNSVGASLGWNKSGQSWNKPGQPIQQGPAGPGPKAGKT